MEDFFIIKNIILQGLKSGYRKKETKGDFSGLDMHNGIWRLSNGLELGSTWDIILSTEFAKVLWGDSANDNLKEIVVMNSQEKLNFIKSFLVDESSKENDEPEFEEIYEKPSDGLMTVVRESLSRLKEYSIGLYKEQCEEVYNKTKSIVSKNSVTELSNQDYVVLNAMNKATTGAISKYLIENKKESFTICPDCFKGEFNHTNGCSIENLTTNWLLEQNDGC